MVISEGKTVSLRMPAIKIGRYFTVAIPYPFMRRYFVISRLKNYKNGKVDFRPFDKINSYRVSK